MDQEIYDSLKAIISDSLKPVNSQLQTIDGKVDDLSKSDVAFRLHMAQENGRKIHHIPPCESLTDHKKDHEKSDLKNRWLVALVIGTALSVLGLAARILF